jgi:hypothetical protein
MTSTDRPFVREQNEPEDRLKTRRAVWRGDSQGRQPGRRGRLDRIRGSDIDPRSRLSW